MRYRITTPEPGWTGPVGTVNFVHGTAEAEATADSAALYYFRTQGYGVEELDAPVVRDVDGDGVLDQLPKKSASTDEWRLFAIEHGMAEDEASQLSRDELVAHYYEEG